MHVYIISAVGLCITHFTICTGVNARCTLLARIIDLQFTHYTWPVLKVLDHFCVRRETF